MVAGGRLSAGASNKRGRFSCTLRARTWQWIGLAVGVALFLAVWTDERVHGPVTGADRAVYDRVGSWEPTAHVDEVGDALSMPVDVEAAVAITFVTVLWWWSLGDRRMALCAAVSGAVVGAAIYGLKQSIQRPLPPRVAGAWYKYSFPSGHTISAVANVGLLVLVAPQVYADVKRLGPAAAKRLWRWSVTAWAALAVLWGCARILSQRHWASDVYASWGVGLAICCAVLLAFGLPRPPSLHAGKDQAAAQGRPG